MRASEYIARALHTSGIDVCFGISGGSIEGVLDDILRMPDRLRFVLARHETAACFQASAHWCFSGRPAAVLTTSGAGLCNAFNGVYEAFASRVPMLVIAGAIASAAELTSNFQNTSGRCGSPDALVAFRATTVFARKVERAEDVPEILAAALQAMHGPRRGPALVILPKDLQGADVCESPRAAEPPPIAEIGDLAAVLAELRRAKRPLLVVGEGVKRHRAQAELLAVVESTRVPVAVTPGGRDCFPNDHPCFVGLTGLFGQARANQAARLADLLVFVGATEEPFNVYGVSLADKKRAAILEGDGAWLRSPLSFSGNLATALARAGRLLEGHRTTFVPPAAADPPIAAGLSTNSAVATIGPLLPDGVNLLYECGLVAAAAVHFIPAQRRSQHELTLSSASMGYAVAGGIGAAIACPERRTVVLTADGSLLMNGAEIHTAVAEGLDILFVVVDNSGHGIGRMAQQIFYEGRIGGTSFPPLDCCQFARALGVPHVERVDALADLAPAFTRALAASGVRLVEVEVAVGEEACPPMRTFLDRAAGKGPIG